MIVVGLAGCATDVDRQVAKADSPGQFVPVLYAVDGDTLRIDQADHAYVGLVGRSIPPKMSVLARPLYSGQSRPPPRCVLIHREATERAKIAARCAVCEPNSPGRLLQRSSMETIDFLPTVKAYPALSRTYGEVSCIAGVRYSPDQQLGPGDCRWIRLYPVPFRDLGDAQKFAKYQPLRVSVESHGSDRRPETRRPTRESIEVVGEKISSDSNWKARRRFIEPLLGGARLDVRGVHGGPEARRWHLARHLQAGRD